ncbi:hypothetical protein HYC85_003653 [Camellia sinensis]|uniref:Uncharacterized protein n=1 Tax=Camellia sinensis TaxID=4442 RepID=A0A7J7HWX7_CAMSI|nr:hypothetical protein HYC85_003653 [Camellia sinensis]
MDEKQSFEALKQQEPEKKTIPDEEQGGGEEEDEEFDEVDDDDDDGGAEGEVGGEQRKQLSELPPIETRYGASQSETLASASSENDLPSDFHTSSHLLSVKENDLTEVPVDYALLRPLVSTEFKTIRRHVTPYGVIVLLLLLCVAISDIGEALLVLKFGPLVLELASLLRRLCIHDSLTFMHRGRPDLPTLFVWISGLGWRGGVGKVKGRGKGRWYGDGKGE